MQLAELDAAIAADPGSVIPSDALAEWVVSQRWFGSKSRDFAQFNVLDAVVLDARRPLLALLLLEARMHAGTHELYQVPIVTRPAADAPEQAVIVTLGDAVVCDALQDVAETARLAALMAEGTAIERDGTAVRFTWTGEERPSADAPARLMGVEQSNTSTVFDERFALKVFRRIEAGTNPELEMLRFLDAHGFAQIAPLEGAYSYQGELLEATLGVMQRYIPHAGDGWTLAMAALDEDRAFDFLTRLHDLGAVTGRMHAVLGSDSEDPDFAPEEPSEEYVALMTATIDEKIERAFVELPEIDELAPIAGRGEELRDLVTQLSHHGAGGRVIRIHGDYHLGQAVFGSGGWTVLDFEGEPARPMHERRRKRSPLRDVAGMLRSFTYATLVSELLHHAAPAPPEWESRAREEFLAGYLQTVDATLLPAGRQGMMKLLRLFELEKLLYELRYEIDNRPDWVSVPVAAIARILEEPLE